MRITDKINFRQPKYMLPAIVYIPLIATGYFVFDMFNTEVAETQDKNLQTTEFLNPNLPGAQIKNGDGIGGKYENMAKSYGRIADYSAVDNIERDNEEEKEAYESKYTEEDLAELVRQAEEKDDAAEVADAKAREAEALEALNKALAEARLRGQAAVAPVAQDTTQAGPPKEQIEVKGQIAEDSKAVKALDEEDKAQEVVKKVKVTSDYFNTLTQNEHEPKLIKAIIDEDVKATDGSRVRLRLLDDIEIGETVVKKGSYLYATMSGFGSQRVKGSINSILVDDELIKVSLSLYDTDGLEGLFRTINLYITIDADTARNTDFLSQGRIKHRRHHTEVIGTGLQIDIRLQMVHIHQLGNRTISTQLENRRQTQLDSREGSTLHISLE